MGGGDGVFHIAHMCPICETVWDPHPEHTSRICGTEGGQDLFHVPLTWKRQGVSSLAAFRKGWRYGVAKDPLPGLGCWDHTGSGLSPLGSRDQTRYHPFTKLHLV